MMQYNFEIVGRDGNVYQISVLDNTQFGAMRQLVNDDLFCSDCAVIGYEEMEYEFN